MSWVPIAAAAIGAWGASKAAKSAAKAEKRRLALMRELERPGLLARQYLLSLIGKESPLLARQYQEALSRLSRTGERTARASRLYWGQTGNIGRARGEIMRAQLATQRAKGELAMGYAGQQEQFRQAPAFALAGQPMTGMQTAIMGLGQAQQGLYQDFASILGQYLGWVQMKDIFRQSAPAPSVSAPQPVQPRVEPIKMRLF